jgi:hypothetical protein
MEKLRIRNGLKWRLARTIETDLAAAAAAVAAHNTQLETKHIFMFIISPLLPAPQPKPTLWCLSFPPRLHHPSSESIFIIRECRTRLEGSITEAPSPSPLHGFLRCEKSSTRRVIPRKCSSLSSFSSSRATSTCGASGETASERQLNQ